MNNLKRFLLLVGIFGFSNGFAVGSEDNSMQNYDDHSYDQEAWIESAPRYNKARSSIRQMVAKVVGQPERRRETAMVTQSRVEPIQVEPTPKYNREISPMRQMVAGIVGQSERRREMVVATQPEIEPMQVESTPKYSGEISPMRQMVAGVVGQPELRRKRVDKFEEEGLTNEIRLEENKEMEAVEFEPICGACGLCSSNLEDVKNNAIWTEHEIAEFEVAEASVVGLDEDLRAIEALSNFGESEIRNDLQAVEVVWSEAENVEQDDNLPAVELNEQKNNDLAQIPQLVMKEEPAIAQTSRYEGLPYRAASAELLHGYWRQVAIRGEYDLSDPWYCGEQMYLFTPDGYVKTITSSNQTQLPENSKEILFGYENTMRFEFLNKTGVMKMTYPSGINYHVLCTYCQEGGEGATAEVQKWSQTPQQGDLILSYVEENTGKTLFVRLLRKS